MDHNRNSLRIGAAAILFALVLRLGSGPAGKFIHRLLQSPNLLSFLVYAETGRHIRFSESAAPGLRSLGESPAPSLPAKALQPLSFSSADLDQVEVRYLTGKRPDLEALLTKPLPWDPALETPTVLILHTHTTESYTKGAQQYTESTPFRTLEEDYNMLSIGASLAQTLEAAGFRVIHDRTVHDHPSYNSAYALARETLRTQLERDPSIALVLDLHRDASGDLGNQIKPVANVNGQAAAQLMLVLGMNHEECEENLALGLKLHAALQTIAPGIMRPMTLRNAVYNQDLCPGALLVEVGAAGNSREQALTAVSILAEGIIRLFGGK